LTLVRNGFDFKGKKPSNASIWCGFDYDIVRNNQFKHPQLHEGLIRFNLEQSWEFISRY
jgi:hypothetical protein